MLSAIQKVDKGFVLVIHSHLVYMDNLISNSHADLVVHSVLGCHISFKAQIRFGGHDIEFGVSF